MRGIYRRQTAKNKQKKRHHQNQKLLADFGDPEAAAVWNLEPSRLERIHLLNRKAHSTAVSACCNTRYLREVETSLSKRTLCRIPTRSIAKKQKLNWAKRSCGSALQLTLSCATNSAVRAAEMGGTSDDSPSSVISSSCRNPTKPTTLSNNTNTQAACCLKQNYSPW